MEIKLDYLLRGVGEQLRVIFFNEKWGNEGNGGINKEKYKERENFGFYFEGWDFIW